MTETNKQNSRQGQTSIYSRQSDQIRQNKKVDNLIPLATSLLKTKQKKQLGKHKYQKICIELPVKSDKTQPN